jgi:hypothetical protein
VQQGEENVGDNEIVVVNNLADVVVAMAGANGFLQHPDQPKDNISVSTETGTFLGLKVPLSLLSFLSPVILAPVLGP